MCSAYDKRGRLHGICRPSHALHSALSRPLSVGIASQRDDSLTTKSSPRHPIVIPRPTSKFLIINTTDHHDHHAHDGESTRSANTPLHPSARDRIAARLTPSLPRSPVPIIRYSSPYANTRSHLLPAGQLVNRSPRPLPTRPAFSHLAATIQATIQPHSTRIPTATQPLETQAAYNAVQYGGTVWWYSTRNHTPEHPSPSLPVVQYTAVQCGTRRREEHLPWRAGPPSWPDSASATASQL